MWLNIIWIIILGKLGHPQIEMKLTDGRRNKNGQWNATMCLRLKRVLTTFSAMVELFLKTVGLTHDSLIDLAESQNKPKRSSPSCADRSWESASPDDVLHICLTQTWIRTGFEASSFPLHRHFRLESIESRTIHSGSPWRACSACEAAASLGKAIPAGADGVRPCVRESFDVEERNRSLSDNGPHMLRVDEVWARITIISSCFNLM